MSVMMFYSPEDPPEIWLPALAEILPEVEVRLYPEIGDPGDIDYALVYKPIHGMLAKLPNLRLIHSIAAGIDHLVADPDLPKAVPLVRMVDDYLREMMAEYALYGVLHFHRDMDKYRQQETVGEWTRHWPRYTPETGVGVLGLGAIGRDVAGKLAGLGFQCHGWSRSPREIEGMTCHHGPQGLADMLPHCQFLVCVLPLTSETTGIIDADLISQLPDGAVVVNLGRGGHVDDAALLAGLDSGKLAGAFLDVFAPEPLDPGHAYWQHPKVVVTPHIAGELVPKSCAHQVARNIRAFEAGETLPHQIDLKRGY